MFACLDKLGVTGSSPLRPPGKPREKGSLCLLGRGAAIVVSQATPGHGDVTMTRMGKGVINCDR